MTGLGPSSLYTIYRGDRRRYEFFLWILAIFLIIIEHSYKIWSFFIFIFYFLAKKSIAKRTRFVLCDFTEGQAATTLQIRRLNTALRPPTPRNRSKMVLHRATGHRLRHWLRRIECQSRCQKSHCGVFGGKRHWGRRFGSHDGWLLIRFSSIMRSKRRCCWRCVDDDDDDDFYRFFFLFFHIFFVFLWI